METKFLHLRTPVEFGSRFGDWQVCWLGGWARFRLYYLVMLVKVPGVIPAVDRGIDLAFGAGRVMNGVVMNTFTIDANSNITAFASLDDARAANINNAEYFGSSQELAKLVASWSPTRPVEIWNSFAGIAPFTELKAVKKFTNRKVAVERIWTAIQVLSANFGKPPTRVAPSKGKRRPTAPTPTKEAVIISREGSKKAEAIDLMRRSQGATLAEITELTGWQSHTVRGFVSGTLIKKLSLNVESFRSSEKKRTYRVK
jgi:phosphopantetheine adenylyltransferase